LQVALDLARRRGLSCVVVGLGDQPLVPVSAWRKVAASPAPIAAASYGGRRRNPVRLAKEIWDMLPAEGDEGARVLMREHPELVEEVPCEGEPIDIDTREDLSRWS
jgi:CTP:molybdopterin cytidylyltransferase MocA